MVLLLLLLLLLSPLALLGAMEPPTAPAAPTAASSSVNYLSDPASFFREAGPRLEHRNGTYHLVLTTPVPVLCAVHYGRRWSGEDGGGGGGGGSGGSIGSSGEPPQIWDGVVTMAMAAPGDVHDVVLPLDGTGGGGGVDGVGVGRHSLLFTAFLPGSLRGMIRSPTYETAELLPGGSLLLEEGELGGAEAPVPAGCPYGLTAGNATDAGLDLGLTSPPPLPTVHSLAYGTAGGGGEGEGWYDLTRAEGTAALGGIPPLRIGGLDAGTEYEVAACFVDEGAEVCCSPGPGEGPLLVRTAEEEEEEEGEGGDDGEAGGWEACREENVALLSLGASVLEVSSNWGGGDLTSAFGGDNAIDGRAASQWSSAGDGDGAYLVVALAEPVAIAGVGVWSRAMAASAEITSFRLSLSSSGGGEPCVTVLGPYDLPDTERMHSYGIMGEGVGGSSCGGGEYDRVRLDVVTSTGGNTGLRSLEVYPMAEACLEEEEEEENEGGDGGEEGAAAMDPKGASEDVAKGTPSAGGGGGGGNGASADEVVPLGGRESSASDMAMLAPLSGIFALLFSMLVRID